MQESLMGYPEERVYLFTEMLEYKREMMSPADIVNLDLWKKVKSFSSNEEGKKYLEANTDKIKSGNFLVGKDLYKGQTGYSSVFFYSREEMSVHFEANGGPASFRGGVYSYWLYADLDPAVNFICSSSEQFINITNVFTSRNIPIIAMYTGSKGMHIYVPIQACKYPHKLHNKANIVNHIFWNKVKDLADKEKLSPHLIDPQIWAVNTVFRHPYTVHNKTGRLKAQMIWSTEEKKWIRIPNDIDFMRYLVKELVFPTDYNDVKPIVEILESDIDIPIPREVVFKDYFPAPYREKVCVYKLMNTILYEGEHRNESMMRLMSYWKHDKELPNQYVWQFMNEWNKQLEPPLKDSELKSIFGGIERYNFNFCKDELMDNYCCKNNQCHLWRYKSSKQLGNSIIDAMTEMADDANDKSPEIDIGQVFEGLPLKLRPSRGRIATFIAGSGVGKTTIGLNIALFAKVPTVVIHYEGNKVDHLESLGLMLGLDPLQDKQKFYEATKHIFFIQANIKLPLQAIEAEVQAIEEIHRVKISLLVIDYLQIMPVLTVNPPVKSIENLVQKIDTIAGLLPDIVRANEWAVVMLAQPKQSVDAYGSNILLENSGKGGQGIQSMSDSIVTAWRPLKSDNPEDATAVTDDVVMSLFPCKVRKGRQGWIMNYNYNADKRLIQGKYPYSVKQKDPIRITGE